MEIKEIIDSGFFWYIISNYVEYNVQYHYMDRDRLIYTLCNSDEEKDIATLAEIKKIKKKIIKTGYEYLSTDFITRYNDTYPVDYTKEENKPNYWVDHFHDFFIRELENLEIEGSLTPFTDAKSKIDKLPENPNTEEIDEDTLNAIFWIDNQTLNIPFVIEREEEIMDQIETDIDNYKENDDWEIDVDFYEGYIKQSEILKLLFKLCKLLVLLHRLKMFKSFLGLKTDEFIRNPLKEKLEKYGFFNLEMVKQIPAQKYSTLIDLIRSNKIPYTIAFLDYLGFLKYLEKEHFKTKYKLNLELAKWFNTNERAIKGNISSLLPTSTEDKNRYTAYIHKETVEKDYQSIK